MLKAEKIAFIGAGNMAEALVSGLLKSGAAEPENLLATDVVSERLRHFEDRYKIRVGHDNQEACQWANIIVLAVKPQVVDEVLDRLHLPSRGEQFIISVITGYSIAKLLEKTDPSCRVVRAMPNTPSLVLEGATALACGPGVSDDQLAMAKQIFDAVGKVVVLEERYLDVVTGLSGGGPAYVYVAIEALADGGVKMGLPRQVAQLLAAQTVLGAARMVLENHEHPGILKDRVASPGGSTIAGLHKLEEGRLRAALISAVEAATKRAQELGRGDPNENLDNVLPEKTSKTKTRIKRRKGRREK